MLNRWKGENVSTTEVSEVLGLLEFIQEANVYGVTIPGLSTQTFQIIVINIQNKISSHLCKCRHLPEGYSCRIEGYRFQERAVDNALF